MSAHSRPSASPWRSPIARATVYGPSLVFAELKAEAGRLTPAQHQVLDVLALAAPVYTWRPSYLAAVLEALQ